MDPTLETSDSTGVPDAIVRLRRDLRGLVALESLQVAFGVGSLVAIAVRAVVVSSDLRVAVSIAAVVLLALVYLMVALRIRIGQEALRAELRTLEHRHALDGKRVDAGPGAHPYRSPARPAAEGLPEPFAHCGAHLAALFCLGLAVLTTVAGAVLLHGLLAHPP